MKSAPSPDEFRGQPLRKFLEALVGWLNRSRVVVTPGCGLRAEQTPGGLHLTADAASGGDPVLVRIPAGGLAPDAHVDCSSVDDAIVRSVRNPYEHTSIPGNVLCWVTSSTKDSHHRAIVWDCPA